MTRFRHRIRLGMLLVSAVSVLAAGCASGGTEPTAAKRTSALTASPSGSAFATAQPARTVRDVAYATRSTAEKLDLYLPPAAPPHPLLVFVHGGGWLTGDKAGPVAQAVIPVLLAQGYAVAAVNYRLSGEARFPAQVQDAKAAIRWLRAHAAAYDLAADRFAGFGESAGAHTLALVATTQGTSALDDSTLGNGAVPSTLASVLLWYPPVDLLAEHDWLAATPGCVGKTEDPDGATSPESRLLGGPVQRVPDRARAANPVTYVQAGRSMPPMLIEHGDRDCTAPLQGSQELYDAVVKAAGPAAAKLVVIKGSGHYLGFDAETAAPAALEFLRQTIG